MDGIQLNREPTSQEVIGRLSKIEEKKMGNGSKRIKRRG